REIAEELARGGVPDFQLAPAFAPPTAAGGNHGPAVRAKGDTPNRDAEPWLFPARRPGRAVKYLNDAVLMGIERIAAAGGKPMAIGAIGQAAAGNVFQRQVRHTVGLPNLVNL